MRTLTAIFIGVLVFCGASIEAGSSKGSKGRSKRGYMSRISKSSKSKRSYPTGTSKPNGAKKPAPSPPPEDIQLSFTGEKIYYVNVKEIPDHDISALFAYKTDWYESYYRKGNRRQLQRRRDSRDITTQFEFVAQNVTTDGSGTPTNEVTYNQVIGFGPTGRRELVVFDVDDMDEARNVIEKIYRDEDALENFAETLRRCVDSFAKLEVIYKYGPRPKPSSNKSSGSYYYKSWSSSSKSSKSYSKSWSSSSSKSSKSSKSWSSKGKSSSKSCPY